MNYLAIALLLMLIMVVLELAYIQWVKRQSAPWLDMVFNLNSGHVLLWLFRGVELWVYGLVFHYANWHVVDAVPLWAQWLLAFVAWDFGFYCLHYCHHKSRLLWAIHLVHHTGQDFNLSLGIRNSWYSSLSSIPFFAWMAVLGFTPTQFLIVSVAHYAIQFYNHNSLYTQPTLLDTILVTPYSHRVHHAQQAPYLNRNFGSCFNVWDRLFGTFQTPQADVPMSYGASFPHTHDPYVANQWPLRRLLGLRPPLRQLLGQQATSPLLVASAGIALFLTVIYYVLFEYRWQHLQTAVWVVALTIATIAIGRYSDGHRSQAKVWCGMALGLAAWVAWQGYSDWRWLLVGVLLAQVLLSLRVLRLNTYRY
ncbi:sterol desaturase family protein [Vitreoscilla massiliensis]|uniref:Sterol desaturase family protein n=1 Tax=Vitreoscilla massiliensis TaxID=1689272 RepID=A0ABY4DZ60_9NEIS|nr:sterol desaturase family protein [Vitreoscilla massiliensis]UOO88363.1 sterol desaturase family protein [Vitreoscilla massiliensis]